MFRVPDRLATDPGARPQVKPDQRRRIGIEIASQRLERQQATREDQYSERTQVRGAIIQTRCRVIRRRAC